MKSSTWKSPLRDSIIGTAMAVMSTVRMAIRGALLADVVARFASHSLGTMCMIPSLSSSNLPLDSIHSSTSCLTSGTHIPVRMKAERTPNPASMPNERNAAISEVRLARNATIVVVEVSMIARPTRVTEMWEASSGLAPFLLSSLYRCSACRLSSIPNASTSIGRRLEN